MFVLKIPPELKEMREGLEALHGIYEEQEKWLWGREVTEHAQHLLHRAPTLQERVLIWIIWSRGLKLFWSQMPEMRMRYLRSIITPAHLIIYQVLFANQDPDHLWFASQDFGYSPNSGDKIVWHFMRHASMQFRRRFDLVIGYT